MSSTKASYAVTSRYALALIELAEESNKTAKIEKDLNDLAAMAAASEDLSRVLTSPSLGAKRQLQAVEAVAQKAGFDKLTQNFLGVLVQNRRLSAVLPIIETVKSELSKRRGEVSVEVQTAQPMSASQMESLQRAISKSMGREVALKATVEPSILGGLVVTVGSKMIDDSVARKLQRLKAAMSSQSNQNSQTIKEVG